MRQGSQVAVVLDVPLVEVGDVVVDPEVSVDVWTFVQ